ncbi:AI-2E family transporter [Candidatus Roizmanbacteria bacterium]|nr:AI-2E family transporter [Candidatus Roizmanbacteria bacterium]
MQKIEISSKTIIFTVGFILMLGVIWLIKDLIFSLFIAFIIAGSLRQPVDFLEKKKIHRSISSFIVYFIFVFIIFYLFALIIPPLVREIIVLFKNLPNIIIKVFPTLSSNFNLSFLSNNIPSLANETIIFIKTAFSNVIFVTSTLFFGFYFLLEKNLAQRLLGNFFDDMELNKINLISERAQRRMSGWFWGEIILMIVVGLLTYVGLSLMGMKYALALAVLSGLLEVVPNLGPITATIPAFFIGLSQSYVSGLSMIALYFTVQQLENNLIVPFVMKKAVGIHPIITLIALIIGGKLAGIMGVILAIPTTIFLETILIEVNKFDKR